MFKMMNILMLILMMMMTNDDDEVWKSEGASIRSIEERPPLIFNPLVSNNTAAPPNNLIFLSSSLYFQLYNDSSIGDFVTDSHNFQNMSKGLATKCKAKTTFTFTHYLDKYHDISRDCVK